MRVSCSYCKRTYGNKEGDGTSHGICPTCVEVIKLDLNSGGNADPEDIRRIVNYQLPACQRVAGI